MSQIARLQQAFADFNEARDRMMDGDEEAWGVLEQYFDPELEVHSLETLPNPGVYRGFDGYRRWFEDVLMEFTDVRFKPIEVREEGPLIAVRLIANGYGRSSGARVDQEMAGVWEMRDGLIKSIHYFASFERALEYLRERVGARQHD